MKEVILSKGYRSFVIIVLIYVALTFFFTGESTCMRDGAGGFCGVIVSILNIPSYVLVVPLGMLFKYDPSSGSVSNMDILFIYLMIVLGWLLFGLVAGWFIQRTKRKRLNISVAPSSVAGASNLSDNKFNKLVFLLYFVEIILILGRIYSEDGGFVFLSIPLFLITSSVFILELYHSIRVRNYKKSLIYAFLIILPFICLGILVYYWSYIRIGGN